MCLICFSFFFLHSLAENALLPVEQQFLGLVKGGCVFNTMLLEAFS